MLTDALVERFKNPTQYLDFVVFEEKTQTSSNTLSHVNLPARVMDTLGAMAQTFLDLGVHSHEMRETAVILCNQRECPRLS